MFYSEDDNKRFKFVTEVNPKLRGDWLVPSVLE